MGTSSTLCHGTQLRNAYPRLGHVDFSLQGRTLDEANNTMALRHGRLRNWGVDSGRSQRTRRPVWILTVFVKPPKEVQHEMARVYGMSETRGFFRFIVHCYPCVTDLMRTSFLQLFSFRRLRWLQIASLNREEVIRAWGRLWSQYQCNTFIVMVHSNSWSQNRVSCHCRTGVFLARSCSGSQGFVYGMWLFAYRWHRLVTAKQQYNH